MLKSLAVLGILVLVFFFIAGAYYIFTNIGVKTNAKVRGDDSDHDKLEEEK